MEGTRMSDENQAYEGKKLEERDQSHESEAVIQENSSEDVEKVEETSSAITNIANILFAPSRAFESIKKKPNWLIPFFIMILAPIGFYLLSWTEFEASIIISVEEALAGSGQQVTDGMMKMPLMFARIGTLVVTPIGAAFGLLVQTTLYFAAAKILRSEVTFKQMFSVCAHVGIISVFTWMLMALMTKLTGTIPLQMVTSLASFLPESYNGTIIQGLLGPIEILAIWSLTLMYMGLRIVGDLSKRTGGVVIGIAFSLTVIISVVTTLLTNLAATL